LVLDHLYRRFNAIPESAQFCAANNLCVPAAAFGVLGGFDSRFRYAAAEDRDLCDRWRHAGHAIVYAAEVRVRHVHRMSAGAFWQKHFHYGRGARCLHRLRGRRQPGRRAGEELGFYLALLASPFRGGPGLRSAALFLLMMATQVATACGYVAEALNGSALPRKAGGRVRESGDIVPMRGR
jgi:hypothetical protein